MAARALKVSPEERILGMVLDAIHSTGSQRGWERQQHAAYLITMLPEDREAALQHVRKLLKLSCGDE